ncbi:MAG: integrase arm-type DNA-binding domain-containing protein [Sutterellaceae bacterium]|nr:integrase arm-type DNA-binding domain-containing protein [Sutterellaceae bacterium]
MRQSDVSKLGDGNHHLGNGLYLWVRDNGAHRSWVLRLTKPDGQRTRIGLGSAATLTLTAAQKKADEFRVAFANGEDPREKKEPDAPKTHRFKEVADEAIKARAEVSQWKNEKHASQWVNTVNTYAVPLLGNKDVAEITRQDILDVLKPIWKTKAETATRLRNRLEVIFDYALRQGWREKENPARWKGGLEFDLPSPKKVLVRKHQEALTFDELVEVVPKLWDMKTVANWCILFGMLTATRCNEFVQADWSEIELKKKVWCIPPERRKDKKPYPHRVPLSSWAIKILKMLPTREGPVFPGRIAKTVNLQTPRVLLQRLSGRAVTMHGCRSTFRDWCAEKGKDSVLAEKSLMHSTGNAVEQAYQRSDLLERRRGLMEEWAQAVMVNVRDS